MAQVNDIKDKSSETCQIILSFLGVLLEHTSQKEGEWLRQFSEMDDSEEFQNVVIHPFLEEEFRKGGNNIEDEESCKVVVTDSWEFLVSSSPLDEVQNDFYEVDDVDGKFDFLQGLIVFFSSIFFCLDQIDTLKCHDVRRHEQGVDGNHGDQEVPHFAECSFGVN